MAKKSKQQPQHLSPERFIRERGRSIPVEKCYLDLESLKELGEGQAVIVRQHKGGKRTIGAYLVDAWCRGVRDAFYLDRMDESDYLVVLAKYRHNAEPEEEYIDLKPILDDLYIDSDSFLKPIKSVRVDYD